MGKEFPKINGLVPAIAPPLGSNGDLALLGHNPYAGNPHLIEIKYAIQESANVRLTIQDKSGHTLRNLVEAFQPAGSHTYLFNPRKYLLAPGEYVYQLESAGKVFSREIRF